MNRFEIFALVAAAIVMLLCADMSVLAVKIYIIHGQMPWTRAVIAVAGWIIFTFGSILVAALFRRWAKRARARWVPDLLFVPGVYIIARLGLFIMASAIGDQTGYDSTLGAPIMPGMLLLPIAFIAYYAAGTARAGRQAETG